MSELIIGQVLSLKIRFNNNNQISRVKHPYLIVDINKELGYVEVAQIDSLAGKEYKAAMRSNKTIYADNPIETVIDKDSYVQLDNTFRIELFSGLENYRRQEDCLSAMKLAAVLSSYKSYRDRHEIDENKNVYMDQSEITRLNI